MRSDLAFLNVRECERLRPGRASGHASQMPRALLSGYSAEAGAEVDGEARLERLELLRRGRVRVTVGVRVRFRVRGRVSVGFGFGFGLRVRVRVRLRSSFCSSRKPR